jgi:ABC-2 type transport system ATP-binding protein
MIAVQNLVFDYPGIRALDDVSFAIQPGSITALVGPNGAGKTTLLRTLAALEHPIAGTILIDGVDVLRQPRECHRKLGYLSDFFGLYDDLTVRQCLLYTACAHLIPSKRQSLAVTRAAERLGIADRLESKAGNLSRGLRQRLAIAQAIVHEPKVLLLDEPASGLDPEARHSLASLFLTLQREGMTLLVSSHILTELAEYSTDMLVLKGGVIVSQQSITAPRTAAVVIRISLAEAYDGIGGLLSAIGGVTEVRLEGTSVLFSYSGDPLAQHRLLKELIERGAPVRQFAEEQVNLQQAYLATVGAAQKGGMA